MKTAQTDSLRQAVFLVLCLIFSAFGTAEIVRGQNIDVKRAEERIKTHLTLIENRKKLMADGYDYAKVVRTLEKSFRDNGISYSMTYADAWGNNGIFLTWSQSAKQFYDFHSSVLNESLGVVTARGYSTSDEMTYLDNGMQIWKQYEQNLNEQFAALVSAFTEEGKVFDAKNEYDKQYETQYQSLSRQSPYPSDAIDALKQKRESAMADYDKKVKQIDDNIAAINKKIGELAAKHVFSVVRKNAKDIPPPFVPDKIEPQAINNNPKPEPTQTNPNPATNSGGDDDSGLPPPTDTDLIRQRCKEKKVAGIDKAEAEDAEAENFRVKAREARQQADKLKQQAEDSRRLARRFAEDAENARRKGDKKLQSSNLTEEEKQKQNAAKLDEQAEVLLKDAAEFANQSKAHADKANSLWRDLEKECKP